MTNIIPMPAPRRGYQAPVPVADFSWHAFWADVADAPVHHSVFALVVFTASCVLIYGSAFVLVEFAL